MNKKNKPSNVIICENYQKNMDIILKSVKNYGSKEDLKKLYK